MDQSVVAQQIERLGGALAQSFGLRDGTDRIPTETLHEVCNLVQTFPGLNEAEVVDTLLFYAFEAREFAQLMQLCRQYCDEAGLLAAVEFADGPGMSGWLSNGDFVDALWLLQALGKVGCRPATCQAFTYCYRQLHLLERVRYDTSLDRLVAKNIGLFLHAAAGEDPFPPLPVRRPWWRGRVRRLLRPLRHRRSR